MFIFMLMCWFISYQLKQSMVWEIELCAKGHTGPGGTQIWFGQGCATGASKPLPIFKGRFGRKGYPWLRIFLEK